jgi:hypothetical protein
LEGALGALLPDAGKQIDEEAGLVIQAGSAAESLCLAAQFCLRPRGR